MFRESTGSGNCGLVFRPVQVDTESRQTMSEEITILIFTGTAYVLAGLCLLLMGYLGWRKWRHRHHRHRHLRSRHQQHRGSWGSH